MSPELHGYLYAAMDGATLCLAIYLRSWLLFGVFLFGFIPDAMMLIRTWPPH